jgi:hypothetical protein
MNGKQVAEGRQWHNLPTCDRVARVECALRFTQTGGAPERAAGCKSAAPQKELSATS